MADQRDQQWADILARVALARDQDEEEEIGRTDLASLLFHASPDLTERVLKEAKSNNRVRRCLAAARHYSGLSRDKCEQIDSLLSTPFPAARQSKR